MFTVWKVTRVTHYIFPAFVQGGGGGQWRHCSRGGGSWSPIGASAGHLRPGKEGEDHSYPRGKCLLHLQQHKPVRWNYVCADTNRSLFISHWCLLCFCCCFSSGFVCFATDSLIITFSPTSSWCSSCSAPSHSLLRIQSETSQLAIL